mmetsp:Transcript_2286/g.2836  ORF Transcript_2286/g.2836 Transcript_2286/m.2836 type:complete len:99 (-) Transcript_2286:135-431(-)
MCDYLLVNTLSYIVWLVSAWIGGLVIITLAVGGIFIARKVMNRELVAKTDTIEIGHNTYLHLEDNRTIVELKDELVAVKKERDHFKAKAEALEIKYES